MKRWKTLILISGLVLGSLFFAQSLSAGALGHYQPGIFNIRDLVVPPEGLYYEQYNFYYHSSTYKDRTGKSVHYIEKDGQVFHLDVDIDVFNVIPMLIWSTGFKILGADYAVYISPTLGNSHIAAHLSAIEIALEAKESQFGIGDLFVQPVWLGWHWSHFDLSVGYGFYAPIGKYHSDKYNNIGLGFWSHQFQVSSYFYPFKNKATAFMLTGTYEINSKQRGTDITPGAHFAIDWGISQYLSKRFEIGISGYDIWQVTDDKGPSPNKEVHNQVHAIGGQISYWPIKDKLYISGRLLREFKARAQ